MTRAFPAAHRVKLETIVVPLEAGDVIVLCTDGAWKACSEQFTRLVDPGDDPLRTLLHDRTIDGRRHHGTADNATVIVVSVEMVGEESSHFS